MVLTWDDAADG